MSNTNTAVTALVRLTTDELDTKDFSTGSKGFFGGTKVVIDGTRHQAQVMAILVGSKGDPSATVTASLSDVQARLTTFIEENLTTKSFASGKGGFHGQGKIVVDGQKFQVSAQAVALD